MENLEFIRSRCTDVLRKISMKNISRKQRILEIEKVINDYKEFMTELYYFDMITHTTLVFEYRYYNLIEIKYLAIGKNS